MCRRHLEVVYKCKPASFRSRVVCGGESLDLACPDLSQRLAILSANFFSAAAGQRRGVGSRREQSEEWESRKRV